MVVAALIAGCGGAGVSGSRQGHATAGAPSARARPTPLPAIGQTLMVSFRGLRAPGYLVRILRRRDAAGVFLAPDNVGSPAQLRGLTATLRRAGGPRLLVATDQEGGAARTLPWVGPFAGESAVASPAAVRSQWRSAGRALCAAGVDVALAPVADVPSTPGAFIAGRAFPGAPAQVAALTAAAVAGLRAGGVAPAVKHFPGLGAATATTDDGPQTLPGAGELRPFAAGIRAGAPLVMVGHGRYPALDPGHIASTSPAIVGGLLRRRLGFRGVVMTDSMEARAVIDRQSLESAALAAIWAGDDLLLLTGPGSWIRVHRALVAAARRSPSLRARLAQAADRVERLRGSLHCPPR